MSVVVDLVIKDFCIKTFSSLWLRVACCSESVESKTISSWERSLIDTVLRNLLNYCFIFAAPYYAAFVSKGWKNKIFTSEQHAIHKAFSTVICQALFFGRSGTQSFLYHDLFVGARYFSVFIWSLNILHGQRDKYVSVF